VNLSARHLSDPTLPDLVAGTAAIHGVPLRALVLEVTETGILAEPTRTDVIIQALRERGVAISIDDYGTGNASLGYLQRLEIDELKIDRSYVSDMSTDGQNLIIVRSTIELALALGLRVVAEGIEDERTTETLRGFGGVIGQGYHLGRPVAPEKIKARLDAERPRGATGPTARR
jgi:EAL domain-containing protein (putative c-di-GMP-specific phosphodiesterase class I)